MHDIGLDIPNHLPNRFTAGFDNGRFGNFSIAIAFHQGIPVGQLNDSGTVNGTALIAQTNHPVAPTDKIAQPALNMNIGSIRNITES
jgi:hypothetical protein